MHLLRVLAEPFLRRKIEILKAKNEMPHRRLPKQPTFIDHDEDNEQARKRVLLCSVEKLPTSKNHHVVGQHFQRDFS